MQKGKETSPRGDDEITVSRLWSWGVLRMQGDVEMNGRDTIAVDFAGDPKAKTRNRAEDVIRDLVGTAWVDEQDKVLVKVQGHFLNNFKIGGGMVANIQKGTSFGMEQRKVNDEVWLPALLEGRGAGASASALQIRWESAGGGVGLSKVQGNFDDIAGGERGGADC